MILNIFPVSINGADKVFMEAEASRIHPSVSLPTIKLVLSLMLIGRLVLGLKNKPQGFSSLSVCRFL